MKPSDMNHTQRIAWERWKIALRELAKASDAIKAAERIRPKDVDAIAEAEIIHFRASINSKRAYETAVAVGAIEPKGIKD